MKKTAGESHRILVEIYGEHALAERTCQKWFARFKSSDFGLEDEECPGQHKKFEDEELEALLDKDCCQTQEELAERKRKVNNKKSFLHRIVTDDEKWIHYDNPKRKKSYVKRD